MLVASLDPERISSGPLPPVDQGLAALVSPSKSILGKSGCPVKNCRMMGALLIKMLGAMVVHIQLANKGAILANNQCCLSQQLKDECGAELLMVLQQVSLLLPRLMREQAEAAGKAMTGLWGISHRGHGMPSAMFQLNANMLQQAQEAHRCAREVSHQP